MRASILLMAIVALVGCDKSKDGGSAPGPGPREQPAPAIAKNWKEFTSANHEFKASFPWGDPIQRPGTLERLKAFFGDSTAYGAEKWETVKEDGKEKSKVTYEFAIVAGKFSKSATKAAREDAVQYLLKNIRTPKDAKKSEPKAITWSGQPATETVYEGEEKEGKKPRTILRQLVTDSVAYFGVIQDAGGLTPAEVSRFFDSFEIVPAAKPK
jgi:hypothetical protein